MMDYDITSNSLRHRLKRSFCFSCCFRRRHRSHLPLESDADPALTWVKPRGPPHDHSMSEEIKEKCRAVLGLSGVKHKRHCPAEFRYDPLSYALNFEDAFVLDDEAPLKNFSSRLPPSAAVS